MGVVCGCTGRSYRYAWCWVAPVGHTGVAWVMGPVGHTGVAWVMGPVGHTGVAWVMGPVGHTGDCCA